MKRLIFIAVAVVLALSIVWVPSVAADGPYPITINKTIPPGGPIEDFTFEAYRDFNNNGIIDFVEPLPDLLVGTVVISGAGTGVIDSPYQGNHIIHEVLIPGSAYEQQPDQVVWVPCHEVIFSNEVGVQEVGEILILKQDEAGEALFGATFEITPDPKTGTGSLTVVDNGLNDELPLADGELLVTGCLVCIPVTVTETVAPDGYILDPTPQPAHVTTAGETVTLTFVNTEEKCELTIYKVDGSGEPLAGACFTITPDPRTGTDSLVLCDNDANDECSADGVLCLSGLICELEVNIEETTVPDGYVGADPQPVIIGETVELTFVNTREMDCGTVCAAQEDPGEYLFGGDQSNWFTWIYYYKGWGSEGDPYEYPIYTGIDKLCGTLYVYDDGTHIFVNYVLTDMGDCTLGGLSEYHLEVDDTLNDLKKSVLNKSGNPVPGKCTYKGTFDPMVTETGWIEAWKAKDDISGWSSPIHIFAHGVGCYYCP
jgi:hypothetical protein